MHLERQSKISHFKFLSVTRVYISHFLMLLLNKHEISHAYHTKEILNKFH